VNTSVSSENGPSEQPIVLIPNEPVVPSFLPVGWVDLVEAAFSELDFIAPGWRLIQVKEKFAGLRIYVHPPFTADVDAEINAGAVLRDKIESVVSKANAASFKTCDVCGSPGDVFGPGHPEWTADDVLSRTRCDRHHGGEAAEAVLVVGRPPKSVTADGDRQDQDDG
jgi:hypothetical protein